jgi:hypothetical protein
MDIEKYYSDVPLEIWKQVLHEDMHYHFGISHEDEDPFEYAVKILYKFISPNSTVLDCGCGWGAPAKMLIRDLNCEVEGVTISKQQYDFIDSFKVYYQDLHQFTPDKKYDTALFLECYTHLNNAPLVLKNLSSDVESIVIKDYASKEKYIIPQWNMLVRSKDQYYDEIENKANYTIQYYKEYKNVLHPSVEYWYKNIRKLPKKYVVGQIKNLYDLCRESILMKYEEPAIKGVIIHATKNK